MDSFTETYDFLVSILGNVPYGVIAIDMEGYITMINENALQYLDIEHSVNKVIDNFVLEYITISELVDHIENCLRKGRKPFDLKEVAIEDKYLTIRGRKILNGFIISIEDVTKTKNAEIVALNAMLEGQEEERHRLAKEIHDGIGPLLSTAKLHLDSLSAINEPNIEKSVKTIKELVDTISKDVRSISHALMPSTLVDFGLVTSLENLCRKTNAANKMQVTFYQSGIKERFEQNIELGLYRITQELLSNAMKYANAKTITIQLIKYADEILLMVEDDGNGFDKEALKAKTDKGIGLKNIQTRAKSIGGVFIIDTQPNRGVSATIEIPIK